MQGVGYLVHSFGNKQQRGADGRMRVIHFKHLFAEADNIMGNEKITLASSQTCSFSGQE